MPSNPHRNIDLDAVRCVDMGHHWNELYFGRADTGTLKGLPIRIVVCQTCHSHRLDFLTWDGRVTSRRYDPDVAYIESARRLGEFNERRRALRTEKARRMKQFGPSGVVDGYERYVK